MVSELAPAIPLGLEGAGAPVERSDAWLMERVRAGEVDAFAPLVKRYERRIFGYLLSQIGEPETAAELAQETFVRVFRAASGYRESGRFEPWLFRIAGNLARSELRRRMRRGPHASVESEEVRERIRDEAAPSPDEATWRREIRSALQQALPRLPQSFREAVVLRYVEGWSYRQIASLLGIEEGTAKSRAHRGLKRLRAQLGPGFEGGVS